MPKRPAERAKRRPGRRPSTPEPTQSEARFRPSALAITSLSVAAIFAAMISWAQVTHDPEVREEDPKTAESADPPSATSGSQPAMQAASSDTEQMSSRMPQAPAEVGERKTQPPTTSTTTGIRPDIATADAAADEARTSEASPSASMRPEVERDASGGEEKMAAKPGITPDIASEETGSTTAAASKPVPATKDPAEKAEVAAKPDKADTIKHDIASDTAVSTRSSSEGIAPDITKNDEPTKTASVAPDIVQEDDTEGEASKETEPSAKTAAPPTDQPSNQPGEVVMAPVPDPAIIMEPPQGALPVISADGRQAWRVYARPFRDAKPDKALIAILLGGMGMSQSATNAAIQQLPGEVTLSFAAYARGLPQWISGARAAGHEVLLQLPMEPLSYPANDPGPHTLLTSLSPAENIDRMEWVLSRVTGYVGVTSFMGSKFTTSPDHLQPILIELKRRGLLFLDTGATRDSVAARIGLDMGLPIVVSDRFFDQRASRVAIDAHFLELEQIARRGSIAVGIGYPYPVTIERLAAWIPSLAQKGIELAPISAIVDRIHRSRPSPAQAAKATPG